MKIFIGIPVYNRKDRLELLSRSLRDVSNIRKHTLCIYDDCSSEFDKQYLEDLFPNAEIYKNETNMGADLNSYKICQEFLKSDNDYLLLCDSDLVLHKESILFIEKHIQNTEGVLSLLNSSGHGHSLGDDVSDDFVIKKFVGAAGMVFSKEIMKELVEKIPYKNVNMWDWALCTHLNSQGIKIFVSKNSYVLHTGIDGENSNVLLFEFSKNYFPATDFDKEQLHELNKLFVEKYIELSTIVKAKIFVRKILRETIRKVIGVLFGYKFLVKLLSWRKRYL